jgi:hypothetical protein
MENQKFLNWRELLFVITIAFFSSYMDNAFGVRNNPWYLNGGNEYFGNILDFKGFAPDQYRILPYLLIKPLAHVMRLEFAFIIFKTIFFALFFYECFNLLTNIKRQKIYLYIILLSFIYTISMHAGYRPDAIFLVWLTAILLRVLKSKWEFKQKSLALYLLLVLISFTRADFALFCAIFLSFYYFKIHVLSALVIVTPLVIQFLLQKIIFPDAVYQVEVITFWQNVLLKFPISSLLFLFPPLLILYWHTFKGFSLFVIRQYPYFIYIFVFYFFALVWVGRITEFRIYLPFIPFLLTFYNEWLEERKSVSCQT